MVEIPWVLSRLRAGGRVLEVGYAFAEAAYLAGLLRAGVELVGADLAARDVDGMETVEADVRALPFPEITPSTRSLVSTLEHIRADNTVYGLVVESDGGGSPRSAPRAERVLQRDGSLLVTVPLGERVTMVGSGRRTRMAGSRLFGRADLFIEEMEAYELQPEGWRAAGLAGGVRYGERGPAASAVLCAELSPGRLRRLLTPSGLATARRRARPLRHRQEANG